MYRAKHTRREHRYTHTYDLADYERIRIEQRAGGGIEVITTDKHFGLLDRRPADVSVACSR